MGLPHFSTSDTCRGRCSHQEEASSRRNRPIFPRLTGGPGGRSQVAVLAWAGFAQWSRTQLLGEAEIPKPGGGSARGAFFLLFRFFFFFFFFFFFNYYFCFLKKKKKKKKTTRKIYYNIVLLLLLFVPFFFFLFVLLYVYIYISCVFVFVGGNLGGWLFWSPCCLDQDKVPRSDRNSWVESRRSRKRALFPVWGMSMSN